MSELWDLGVQAIADGVRQGQWSAAQVIESVAHRIEHTETALRAWACLDLERALDTARAQDRAAAPRPALGGVPVGVKDVIATCDLPTGMGSTMCTAYLPAADAEVVTRLRAAGAVVAGKTVTTSFAGPDPAVTVNPWNAGRTPGGSSAGSAAAVAAGMVPAALGTQTAGSVLRPAAYCGVVGFKPTFGAIATDGVFPFARSLDTVGIMARSVGDVGAVFAAVRRRRSTNGAKPSAAGRPRVHVVDRGADISTVSAEHCRSVADRLAGAGFDPVPNPIPVDLSALAAAQAVIVRFEAAVVHAECIATRPLEFEPRMRSLIEDGLRIGEAEYRESIALKETMMATVDSWLAADDLVVLPTVDGPVPDRTTTGSPALQAIFTFLGLPALTLPTGFDAEGLPVGIQLVAGRGRDDLLLGAAGRIEAVLGYPVQFPLVAGG